MLLAVVLAQLAFFISCTFAFFPFTPAWLKEQEEGRSSGEARRTVGDRSAGGITLGIAQRLGQLATHPSERAAREAARLTRKYGGRGTPQQAGDGSVSRRANQYKIVEAADPGQAMTAGISQDGTDYSYFVQVELGSKGKKLYMLVDTGAGSSWIMGSDCQSDGCAKHASFGPDDSDTFEGTTKAFSVSYGSGKVQGTLTTDTIGIAGMSFKYQFGLASTTSADFAHFAFDGILGMSMNKGANENFLDTLGTAEKLDKNIFCITLSRASDGANTGEIRFGSTNKDKFSGDIVYTPVAKDGDWAVNLDDMAYDGKKAGVGGIASYIDTGTSFIFGSKDVVKKVHSVIPGATSSDGVTYNVPCDSNKPLTVTFSGTSFQVSAKDWIAPMDNEGKCTSNIYGYEVVTGAWLLGDTFLKNVYAVFDKDQKRIGFARLAGVTAESKPSSTSNPANPTTSSKTSKSSGPTESSNSSKPEGASSTGSAATTFSTGVTSGSETPTKTKPVLGLSGHETHAASGTAAAETKGGKDSSGSDSDDESLALEQRQNAKLALIMGVVACIAIFS